MGQYVVDPKIARDRCAEHTGGVWSVVHHIEHPASGQPRLARRELTATEATALSTAVATSDAAVWTWVQATLPAAWQWSATDAAYFRQSCQDVSI